MTRELWKPIDGFEDRYEISNLGRVRNSQRNRIRRCRVINRGYEEIKLAKNGKVQSFLVHRLVATAFCENPQGFEVVNHIDNNPLNNNANNLEWVTQKANVHHAAKIGVFKICGVVRSDGVVYPSVRAVATDGFNPPSVCDCCKGKRKTHKGYTWRYATP